jgi:hypothetical protein
VRHAPALEDAHRAVVHDDRDRDLHALLAVLEDADEVRVDAKDLADPPELLPRQLVRVHAQVRD